MQDPEFDTVKLPRALLDNARALGDTGCFLYLMFLRVAPPDGGWFEMPLEELARFSVKSVPTIRKYLPAMEDLGLIEIDRGGDGMRVKHRYRVVGLGGDSNKERLFNIDEEHDAFEAWWAIYPRKGEKGPSRSAFDKALKKVTYQDLMAATKRYAEYVARERIERRFVKQGRTYLNQECWHDDYSAPKARETARADEEYDDF